MVSPPTLINMEMQSQRSMHAVVREEATSPRGGYESARGRVREEGRRLPLRHSEIRDVLAEIMLDLCCKDVTEPELQPLSADGFEHRPNGSHSGGLTPRYLSGWFLGDATRSSVM